MPDAPTTQAEQEDAVREPQADLRRLVNESNQTVFIRNFLRPVADRIDVYVDELRTERDQLAADLRKAREERDRLREAHRAARYLSGLYRRCWLGRAVRDLGEAEAAYDAARAALTPDPKDAGGTAKGDDHG